MAKIGFIGLGHMGLPMVVNLIRAQHEITGYDISPAAQASLTQAGGTLANNLPELAKQNDIVITMLQTGAQVQAVCYGESGIYAHAKPNTLHIDCSTIDVPSAQDLQNKASQHALLAVDAPVSGGVSGAQAGTLTFLLGGDATACATAQPILQSMGKQIILTGASGSGQAAKICNNMLLGISMLAVSECFLLAERLGLSAQKLHEVVTHASGQCWVMDRYVPVPDVLENVPANHDYQAGFSLNMMLKDLNFSQAAAQHCDLKTPLGQLATKIFQQGKEAGLGDLDFSAIIKTLGS
ncbi:MAG: 3-hydroxyisobutyrate dehydrogenase [Legionellales bacterium]|nr:3-hydroxyisobutyrate dehydrogenase [Legionellales bacterium]